MIEKVRSYIEKHQMLQRGDHLIIGVSGGADSVCLLFVLIKLKKDYDLKLTAVHVNHNIRGEAAARDQEYVEAICESWGVKCVVYDLPVEELARKHKRSVEEMGRDVRREAFLEVKTKVGAQKIVTAHHQNDNVETLLMNMSRGTGLTGLTGISPKQEAWIRPLLNIKRESIEAYLKQQGITYCNDETNAHNEYTRNRIRNQIIPLLEECVNPQIVSHVSEVIEECSEIELYLQGQVDKIWKNVVQTEEINGVLLDKLEYEKLDTVLQNKLMKRVIEQVANRQRNIGRVHVEQVHQLLQKQVGREIHLPYEVVARREYQGIRLYKRIENVQTLGYHKVCIKELETGVLRQIELSDTKKVTVEVLEAPISIQQIQKDPYTKYFDCDIIGEIVWFRPKEIGDKLVINKKGNTQTVKKYCVTNKIPASQRDSMILMVAKQMTEEKETQEQNKKLMTPRGNVIWIMGHRTSEEYLLSKETKRILKVQYNGGNYGRNN